MLPPHKSIAGCVTSKPPYRYPYTLLFCAVLLVSVPPSTHAQAAPKPMITGSAVADRMEQERLHLLAEERQRKMLQDADKLLAMAQQLKASVDKSDKNTLSVEVVKEAERIEKLARQVKDTMRQ